jgi:hypothetical protein
LAVNINEKIFFLLFVVLLLIACSRRTYQKFDYNNGPNPWVNAFKDRVFFACLHESYKDDSLFKAIDKKDGFNPYDGLEGDAIIKASELAKKLIRDMPPAVFFADIYLDTNSNFLK